MGFGPRVREERGRRPPFSQSPGRGRPLPGWTDEGVRPYVGSGEHPLRDMVVESHPCAQNVQGWVTHGVSGESQANLMIPKDRGGGGYPGTF